MRRRVLFVRVMVRVRPGTEQQLDLLRVVSTSIDFTVTCISYFVRSFETRVREFRGQCTGLIGWRNADRRPGSESSWLLFGEEF